jgi:hypothetical protein
VLREGGAAGSHAGLRHPLALPVTPHVARCDLMRGDSEEINGFCSALTDIVVSSDECGDWSRMFGELAEKRCGPA